MKANKLELAAPPSGALSSDQTASHVHPSLPLSGLEEAESVSADPDARALAGWVRSFLMRAHPDLGRAGHVCPFTSQAVKLTLLRVGVSPLGPSDQAAILQTMGQALRVFDDMPCKASTRVFRTVIVGFPKCADPAGIATLHAVQNALRHHSIIKAKMIGLFEPQSQAEGLVNHAFRPLRSPVPALAIRMLVEQDAPFVMRNPLLVPVYLARFPLAGTKRLVRAAFTEKKDSRIARTVFRLKGLLRGS